MMRACPICGYPTSWATAHSPVAAARCESCACDLYLCDRTGPSLGAPVARDAVPGGLRWPATG